MNYINWLEQKLLKLDPIDTVCETDGMRNSDWCNEHCDGFNRECLKRAYEVEQGENNE